MAVTIVNSALNALTVEGLNQLWRGGFGLSDSLPNTAALVLQPTNLLQTSPLAALTMADLEVDPDSPVDITGAWEVMQDQATGIVTASVSVELSPTTSAQPSGAIVYNEVDGVLWYITAFSTYPPQFSFPLVWEVMIVSSICQG